MTSLGDRNLGWLMPNLWSFRSCILVVSDTNFAMFLFRIDLTYNPSSNDRVSKREVDNSDTNVHALLMACALKLISMSNNVCVDDL